MHGSLESELQRHETDGISSIVFAPSTNLLLVSSWDFHVRLYDVIANNVRAKFRHQSAALDVCFSDNSHGFSGGVDRVVKGYDLSIAAETVLGIHDKAVKCVEYSPVIGAVISGSWDKTVKVWDPRAPKTMGTYPQPDRVYTMAVSNNRLVVGTAGRHVHIFDLRHMAEPQQRRESSLKYQTRCIRAFPDHSGYALSSIEGRVAMEYYDPSPEVQANKYAFKCHRTCTNGVDTVYPVNTLAFHPVYGTFASGGCDGIVNIWDGQNKKRLCQFHKYPTSIAGLAFNHSGNLLAIASSYTFEEGNKEHPADTIYVRQISESDVKPKPKVVGA